jgi:hypothetical protein
MGEVALYSGTGGTSALPFGLAWKATAFVRLQYFLHHQTCNSTTHATYITVWGCDIIIGGNARHSAYCMGILIGGRAGPRP